MSVIVGAGLPAIWRRLIAGKPAPTLMGALA